MFVVDDVDVADAQPPVHAHAAPTELKDAPVELLPDHAVGDIDAVVVQLERVVVDLEKAVADDLPSAVTSTHTGSSVE